VFIPNSLRENTCSQDVGAVGKVIYLLAEVIVSYAIHDETLASRDNDYNKVHEKNFQRESLVILNELFWKESTPRR
jgi:hypothetical protein